MNNYKISVLGVLLLWGCHGNPKTNSADAGAQQNKDTIKHSQVQSKPLETGKVLDTIQCTDSPGQKYAIYIPSNYTPAKKWPVVYFFDPHGVGNLPLNLYRGLAEKYGFIIAGTYGSKNGMQMDASEKAAQAMMSDVSQRLSVDNARLYTFGFSGGARVACSLALNGGIAGVVACGGGFPQNHPQINQPFNIILFVGEKDFNYIKLKELDKQLENSPLVHQLIVFHGKHQWPPVADAGQAFQWMDVCAMRANTMTKNDSIIKAIEQQYTKEAEKNGARDKSIHEYFTYKKLLNFLRDLTNVDKYVSAVNSFENSGKLAKYNKDEAENEVEEAKLQQTYLQFLSDKDQAWWQDKIKEMHSIIAKDSTSPVALETQRLLSFLSLAVYMGASHSFNSPDDASTARFLSLYGLVDPANPEHSYLFAGLYARENNADKAISSLQEAVRLGFADLKRLEADSNFNSIKNKPAFKEIEIRIAKAPAKIDMTQ